MEIIGIMRQIEDENWIDEEDRYYRVEICTSCATEKELVGCEVITKEKTIKSDIPLFCHQCGKALYETKNKATEARGEKIISRIKAEKQGIGKKPPPKGEA